MREMLEEKLKRFSELERQMADPEVLSNSARVAAVAREHGSLQRLANTYRQFKEISPMTAEEIARLVDIFDRDIPLAGPISCETVFRLDFETPDGIQSIEWLCEEEKNLATGAQGFWVGMTGTVPVQVGEIIGTYLVGGPIPTLPTSTP